MGQLCRQGEAALQSRPAHYVLATVLAAVLGSVLGSVLAVGAGAAPSVQERGPQAETPGSSVRVLTFNTALFSPMFQCAGVDPVCHLFNPLGEYINKRAQRIADLLEPGYFDVVVLNEVWDEDDGKEVLVERLRHVYPHYVKYVDVFGGGFEEDSGLMIFSKFPFEDLPGHHYVSEDNESSGGDDWDHVAYVDFADCEDDDCLAAKGAVLVRLRHPSSERLINVVATHMQADYGGPKYDEVRWKQLRQIRGQCEVGPTKRPNLIHESLKPSLGPLESLCGWTNKQWLVVAGDLNIQGEGAAGEALHPVDPADAPSKGPHEWWWKIGNPAVASIALYDAWAETTSALDAGITHAGSEEETSQRLDYILTTRRNAQFSSSQDGTADLCVQHMWIPAAFEGLSDHRPVAADLNLEAPQCNPRLAYKLAAVDWGAAGLKGGKEAKKLHRELVHPGSMQWYRLDEGGTYSIALDPAAAAWGATFAVYAASDLSTPLQGAYDLGTEAMTACDYPSASGEGELVCEEVTGQKFVLPKGPLYVRVFAPDRAQSGAYWIAMHKYDCKSQDEACVLLPNAPAAYAFPAAGTPLNAEDEAWFRGAILEQADSGRRQKLRFYVENVQGADWPQPGLTLTDAGGAAVLTQLGGQPLTGPAAVTSASGNDMIVIDGETRTDAEFFLRVRRSDVEKTLAVRVGWQTNLVLLGGSDVGAKPAMLVCVDETNPESGEDSIELEVNIDGAGWQKRGSASFDCDNTFHPFNWDAGLGIIRYLDSVRIRLVEVDEGPNDVGPAFAPPKWPMEIDVTEAVTHDMLWWMWDGGHYRLYFNQGKWRTQ